MDNSLEAKFTNGTKTITVPGFYDGDGIYKIRFSPDQKGHWTYITTSNTEAINIKNRYFSMKCAMKEM